MVRIKREFKTRPIQDIPAAVQREMAKLDLQETISPGARVAVAVGSRGINNIATVVLSIIKGLKDLGAKPFVIPAMGSHGGATAEGQKMVLAKYGITKEAMGVPIKATMQVVEVGSTPQGLPVFLDKNAHKADHIVVVNRVKAHTDFMATVESGLMKMMTIGLGKQKGADLYHQGVIQHGYYPIIIAVGREILKRCPIAFGVSLVENERDETAIIQAMPPKEIEAADRALLRKAKRMMPRLPLDRIDLLIIDEIGKEVSGAGMDPNVVARHAALFAKFPSKPKILRIFVRDLSPKTYGNATGIGAADFTTKRLVKKIDLPATYMNCVTGCSPEHARIPMYFDTDREVIDTAFRTLGMVAAEEARVVHIANTLKLEEMEVSESVLAEIKALPDVTVMGKAHPMAFDRKRNLVSTLPTH
jgi:hypothetical protein